MPIVQWCKWSDIVNEAFIPYIDNRDRYLIHYGGRGSAKSNYAAKKLIYRCLTEKYFRYILIRNTYATIKDSSYQTIKDIIYELGLDSLFEFKLQPLEIHCRNGNMFLARGCDDTTKLKSIKDPTGAWYEEDIPTESDWITITTSIRTTKAEYLQEIFTINPEVTDGGNYQDNWFWKRFFAGRDTLSFSDVTRLKIDENTVVNMTYTVHHSTYKDNRWIPNEFIAFLMDLKRTNPYYYTIYCLGHWGNKQLGGRFYKCFDIGKNTYNYKYNPSLPLHISFDFNVNPFMTCSVWQIEGRGAYLLNEIAMKDPHNKVSYTCREFMRLYNTHGAGLFVYGDPNGRKEDTRQEKGHNDYKIVEVELAKYRPTFRVATMAPPVKTRGDFINTIFESKYDGIGIFIREDSVYLKADLTLGLEASDGTKHKEKIKGEDGRTFEKYHHFSDSMDYFICEAFKDSFIKYQRGDVAKAFRPVGRNVFNEKHKM